jgi:hypothetical protein
MNIRIWILNIGFGYFGPQILFRSPAYIDYYTLIRISNAVFKKIGISLLGRYRAYCYFPEDTIHVVFYLVRWSPQVLVFNNNPWRRVLNLCFGAPVKDYSKGCNVHNHRAATSNINKILPNARHRYIRNTQTTFQKPLFVFWGTENP